VPHGSADAGEGAELAPKNFESARVCPGRPDLSNDAIHRKGWYASAGSAAGGEIPEGEGPLPAHAAPGAEGKWGHVLSRRGGSPRRAHVGRQLSWDTKPGGLDIPSAMPKGASLSPTGSIGLNRQKEVGRVFSHPIKGSGGNVDPAKHIPLKEPFAK